MNCPKHNKELIPTPITKGERLTGINKFCTEVYDKMNGLVKEKDKEIEELKDRIESLKLDLTDNITIMEFKQEIKELKTKLKEKEEAVEGILNPRQVAGIFEDWQQQNKFKYDEKYFMTFIEWSNYLLKQLKKKHTK